MRTRNAALFMAGLLALYLILVGQRAVAFLTSGEMVGRVIGGALCVLPVIAAWALVREVSFGFRSANLLRELDRDGELPVWANEKYRGRRNVPKEMTLQRDACAAEVTDRPGDWQAWFRLGLIHDACGDRRQARNAIRRAIALNRSL